MRQYFLSDVFVALFLSVSVCWLNLPAFSAFPPFSSCSLTFLSVLPPCFSAHLLSPSLSRSPSLPLFFPLQVRRTIAVVWVESVSRTWCVRRNVAAKAPWSTAPISSWPVYLRTSPNTPQTCKSAVVFPTSHSYAVLYAARDETSDRGPCVRLLKPETVNHHMSFNVPQTCQEVSLAHTNNTYTNERMRFTRLPSSLRPFSQQFRKRHFSFLTPRSKCLSTVFSISLSGPKGAIIMSGEGSHTRILNSPMDHSFSY